MKKNKLTNNNLSSFDTIELFYPEEWTSSELLKGELMKCSIKGFILSYKREVWSKTYDEVVIGFSRVDSPSYFGHNLILNTTRMVLIEKYDYKLNSAHIHGRTKLQWNNLR